ncbi:hypothetical protein [Curtobacterium citri]|nr:hypothetical protein [Curtobacterium citri]
MRDGGFLHGWRVVRSRRAEFVAWPAVVVGTGVRDDLPWADALPT